MALTVTNPVNVFVPVVEDINIVPLVPAPTVVVPVTVKLNPAAVNVVPLPILKFPPTVTTPVFIDVTVQLNVKLRFTVVAGIVFVPEVVSTKVL